MRREGSEMKISVLLVMEYKRRERLMEQLESCGMDVLAVADCDGARRILRQQPLVHVVLTDERLRDGNWLSVLDEIRRNQLEAETIVCSRIGDPRLWVHILGYGAYDLLVEPWETGEVRRIIEGRASENWMRCVAASA